MLIVSSFINTSLNIEHIFLLEIEKMVLISRSFESFTDSFTFLINSGTKQHHCVYQWHGKNRQSNLQYCMYNISDNVNFLFTELLSKINVTVMLLVWIVQHGCDYMRPYLGRMDISCSVKLFSLSKPEYPLWMQDSTDPRPLQMAPRPSLAQACWSPGDMQTGSKQDPVSNVSAADPLCQARGREPKQQSDREVFPVTRRGVEHGSWSWPPAKVPGGDHRNFFTALHRPLVHPYSDSHYGRTEHPMGAGAGGTLWVEEGEIHGAGSCMLSSRVEGS